MSIFYLFTRFPFLSNRFYKLSSEAHKCIRKRYVYMNLISQRSLSQKLHDKNFTFTTFNELIEKRRLQANRSILVQVQSAQSYKELYSYCSTIGTVKQMFHYETGVEPLHFIIVEFSKEADVTSVLSNGIYVKDAQVVPVQSLFLWFKATGKKSTKQKYPKAAKLEVENGLQVPNENDIKERLQQENDISGQMQLLYNVTKLNDTGTRLRFLVTHQIESALSSIFPYMAAYPFGSSVNGFGKTGCDLDIVLRLYEDHRFDKDSRLVFHCKAVTGSERSTSQRHMEAIGDLLQLFLPGCTQVRRILQARVPIIKYYQQLADVECDLSMSNMTGVYMSDLLHIMGEFDDRVRPLVFTIRKWASELSLTNSYPGRWITNFSLTLMIIAFLQKPKYGSSVLPNLNSLIKAAGPEDTYITEDGVNCTFLRDLSKLEFKRTNTDSLQSLLQQFFEYYSQFDFSMKGICLNNGTPITKPDHSPLYIVNPLERGLNVSKNVSIDELEKLKMEMRNAAWILEAQDVKTMNYGLLSLFDKKKFSVSSKQGKLLEVSKLFEEGEKLKMDLKNEDTARNLLEAKDENKENSKHSVLNLKRGKSRR